MNTSLHSAWLEINLNHLKRNFSLIRAAVPPYVSITTPVKSNAYGHGLIKVAQALIEAGADRLAISNIAEGVSLRQAGIQHPLLCLYPILKEEASHAIHHQIQITTGGTAYDRLVIEKLAQEAKQVGSTAQIHLMIDSGIGRYGVDGWNKAEILELVHLLHGHKTLKLVGIGMQFANAEDSDPNHSLQQLQQFKDRLTDIEQAGYPLPHDIHAANSASVLHFSEAHFTVVRPGLMNYGYQPSANLEDLQGLKPILAVKARVLRVRSFPKSHTIGYGMKEGIKQDTTVAFVPFGYEYGFCRALCKKGYVLIQGQKALIIGSVSMNSIAVDVSRFEEIGPEEEVIIIGRQGKEEISLHHWADWLGTNVNEIMVRFSSLLPRIYLQ
ncbi:MAG: alanine racemase [Bacteroidota bacterium]